MDFFWAGLSGSGNIGARDWDPPVRLFTWCGNLQFIGIDKGLKADCHAPYCDSKVPAIRETEARSDDEGRVIASLSCEAISLGFVILRNEGSNFLAYKILRVAQNDRSRLFRSTRNDGR